MRRFSRFAIIFALLILFSAVFSAPGSLAQEDACPALVEEALDAATRLCDDTGRNQACYGHIDIEANPKPTVQDFNFDTPGDIVNLLDLATLQMSPMVEPSLWGVAMMRVQANLPYTLPGQNVAIVLFGDVFVLNQGGENGDYGPMQAFYFRSGIGNPACEAVPRDGMLIQTPRGVGRVELRVNGVDINLGSTAYLRAVPGEAMTIDLIEGSAEVSAFDETLTLEAGIRAILPLDISGLPVGPPQPDTFPLEEVANLPLDLLDDPVQIVIADPVVEPSATPDPDVPNNLWLASGEFGSYTCSDGSPVEIVGPPQTQILIDRSDGGASMQFLDNGESYSMQPFGLNAYTASAVGEFGITYRYSLFFSGRDTASLVRVYDFSTSDERWACKDVMVFTDSLVRAAATP